MRKIDPKEKNLSLLLLLQDQRFAILLTIDELVIMRSVCKYTLNLLAKISQEKLPDAIKFNSKTTINLIKLGARANPSDMLIVLQKIKENNEIKKKREEEKEEETEIKFIKKEITRLEQVAYAFVANPRNLTDAYDEIRLASGTASLKPSESLFDLYIAEIISYMASLSNSLLIQALIEKYPDILTFFTKTGETALSLAIMEKNQILKDNLFLAGKKDTLHTFTPHQQLLLYTFRAVITNWLSPQQALSFLITKLQEHNLTLPILLKFCFDDRQNTLLHYAAGIDNGVMGYLLQEAKGITVQLDCPNDNGLTPLAIALKNNCKSASQALLAAGANPALAIDAAAAAKRFDIVTTAIQKQPNSWQNIQTAHRSLELLQALMTTECKEQSNPYRHAAIGLLTSLNSSIVKSLPSTISIQYRQALQLLSGKNSWNEGIAAALLDSGNQDSPLIPAIISLEKQLSLPFLESVIKLDAEPLKALVRNVTPTLEQKITPDKLKLIQLLLLPEEHQQLELKACTKDQHENLEKLLENEKKEYESIAGVEKVKDLQDKYSFSKKFKQNYKSQCWFPSLLGGHLRSDIGRSVFADQIIFQEDAINHIATKQGVSDRTGKSITTQSMQTASSAPTATARR